MDDGSIHVDKPPKTLLSVPNSAPYLSHLQATCPTPHFSQLVPRELLIKKVPPFDQDAPSAPQTL